MKNQFLYKPIQHIVTLIHEVDGEGFNDLSFADLDELLADKDLEVDKIIDVVCA